MEEFKTGLNANQLKLIAITSMTVDHLASVIWPGYQTQWWLILLHIFGRLAAPIFWFMIVEGYTHTHDLKKYIGRLFTFAVISHFAYNFAFGIPFIPFQTSVFNQTSVIWVLAWSVVCLAVCEDKFVTLKQWQKTLAIVAMAAITFCADWSCIAMLAIMRIYDFRGNLKKQMVGVMTCIIMYAIVYCAFIDVVYGLIQLGVILVYPFMKRYNGQKGSWKGMKWLFYAYYPAHLILCGIIRVLLHGNVGVMIGA